MTNPPLHPIQPTVGILLGGSVFAPGPAVRLGAPYWNAAGLARDLELRLGVSPHAEDEESVRAGRWRERVRSLADGDAFYARSLAIDELGTVARLVQWRDTLVEGGWNGDPIPSGGARLAALAALERHEPESPHRLVVIEDAVRRASGGPVYAALDLLDDTALWPGRWRRIFALLASRGTAIRHRHLEFDLAAPSTDLGKLQRHLRGETLSSPAVGDGSVIVLRGDTPADLAELTAALLAAGPPTVVVRCTDGESLDHALPLHGSPAQGHTGESAWRPATQLLPLALEIAFEPRDPYRVLELLTLPSGPFRGVLGARLARAVTRQPGVGGKEWNLQKVEAYTRLHDDALHRERAAGRSDPDATRAADTFAAERLARVADWLEGPGAPRTRIERAALLAVVERVRSWLLDRIRAAAGATFAAAHQQARVFADAVASDPRTGLSLEEVRQLFDQAGRSSHRLELAREEAGRIAHVGHPASLHASQTRVVLWSLVGGIEPRPQRLPWNAEERAALEAADVYLVDPAARLAAEAAAWRQSVLAAREQLVLVVPRSIKGATTEPHPLWNEIRARLDLDEARTTTLTREARRLLEGGARDVSVRVLPPLPLPDGRARWHVPADLLRGAEDTRRISVTALERIATCPFSWVLEHRAGLFSGSMTAVARHALLNGGIAHRLVELLYGEDAFARDEDSFLARAAARFDELLRTEGTSLLLPGASIERAQLRRQLLHAVRALHRYLVDSGWRIAAVEEEIEVASSVGPLHGRLDLRLIDAEERVAVLDMKWGGTSYREKLSRGLAVQLAVYVRAVAALQPASWGDPPAGYFACSTGTVLTADPRLRGARTIHGPTLAETWQRVETTARAVLEAHERGVVHVPAARELLPILDALHVGEGERANHLEMAPDAACGFCSFDAICGRKWRAFA